MFTFQGDPSLFKRGTHKMSSIPDIIQPQKVQPLPPLPFYIQATEPLPMEIESNQNYKNILSSEIQKQKQQYNQLNNKYKRLYEEHSKVKRQYEQLKLEYKEGEQLFQQMESMNIQLFQQIQSLKNKKQQKSRISVGIKKKQIPIVKINVPNPKNLSYESQRQSNYRQLKAASDELAYVKKLLESEKQKSEYTNSCLNKSIQKLAGQRDSLKQQISNLKDENKAIREELNKNKYIQSQTYNTNTTKTPKAYAGNEYQKLRIQFERLEKVHRSCDILLVSKQTEIVTLKQEIHKLTQTIRNNDNQNESFFHRTQSRRNLDQRQTNIKQNFEAHTLFPQSSAKKVSDFYQVSSQYSNILQQHLELSVKQMKSIEQFTKVLVSDFITKIDYLKNQLSWANQKIEYQKDELERVYEILRNKKVELDNCYNQLKNGVAMNNRPSTPIKQMLDKQEEYLKSILKGRRNLSA